mgnify:CR=1 FL=1
MFTYYNNVREVLEMNVYTTEKIRNVVLLGHSGCGKTSLVEAMAYLAGQTTRMGTVADGSTISDFDKEEIKRQFSIHTSVVPIEWDNVKINLVDDLFDFLVFTAKLALAGIGAEHDVIWQRFMFERSVRFYGIVRHIRQIGNFVVRTLKLAEQAAVAG